MYNFQPIIKKVLFYFAALCWVACLIIHSLTFADIDVRNYFPDFDTMCFAALFSVWMPTIYLLRNNKDFIQLQHSGIIKRMNAGNYFNTMFKGAPTWLTVAAIACFVYASINFFLVLGASNFGSPEETDGKYFLMNHSEVIKTISRVQYLHYKALETRLSSGHFSGFFSIATAVLYPFKKQAGVPVHQPPAAGS